MIRKIVTSLKQFRQAFEDQNLGRELIGTDPHGNRYYQYYNSKGKPIRRMSERIDKLAPFVDPLWEEWIRFQRDKPYSKDEIVELKKKQASYQQQVNDYEKKDQEMMNEHKKQQQGWKPNK